MNFEILAPAGSWSSLVAGIRCGADAVYFGAKSFNARRNAGNFDDKEFENAIMYCQNHNVKAYITINTLCKDSEFEDIYNIVESALSCGASAFIVQDLGVAKMIKECFPAAVLHASTQMSVASPSGAKALKDFGFKRVILARELSEKEISEIAASTDITLEAFVHGSLCMSVSGQCYLSSMLGGRSGNRGLCAQPCRLPFTVAGGENKNALSLKDLSLIDYLARLNKCGVYSLKIEGRMKSPEYVAASVTALKKAINGEYTLSDKTELKDIFSRNGFTSAYFDGNLKNMFGTRQDADVIATDKATKRLTRLYEKEHQTVPLNMVCCIKSGKRTILNVKSPNKSVTVVGDVPSVAVNRKLTESEVCAQLSKLGGTQYYLSNAKVKLEDKLMLSAAQINDLRRRAVAQLNSCEKIEVKHYEITYVGEKSINRETEKYYTARFSSVSQIPKNHPFKRIFIPFNSNPDDFIKYDAGVELPRICFGSETIIESRLLELKKIGVQNALCGNLSMYYLARKLGFTVYGDYGLNIMNSNSAKMFNSPILSFELNKNSLNSIQCADCGIIAYGYLPLMLMRNCPVKNEIGCSKCKHKGCVTDRTGVRFKISCSSSDYVEMLNCLPLFIADKQDEFQVNFLHFYFTGETETEVSKIISMYMQRENADFKYTRALYYRKLL